MLDYRSAGSAHNSPILCEFAALDARDLLDLVLRREFYDVGKTTGGHRHLDFCALYIVKSGRGIHLIDGVPFGIARGDVYLLPPGATHAYTDYQALEIDAFYFPLSLWSEAELSALRENSGFWRLFLENDARRLHLRPEAHTKIEKIIAEMRAERDIWQKATPFLLRSALFRLLVTLARLESDDVSPSQTVISTAPPRLSELLAWCEANVGADISVAGLAGRMFLSPGHFARLFKREIGMPPALYLRRLKLEKARSLLENSPQSVAHIAREAGFEDAAHFSRAFRTCYGVTPGRFRRGRERDS